MAVNPIIECFWRDLIPAYCVGLETSAFYTEPPFFVESVHGRSNWSLPRLPLHMHVEDIIPTVLNWNIYIWICLRKALTLTRLRCYEMLQVILNVIINKSVGLRVSLKFRLRWDAFLHRMARGIPLKDRVPYTGQSKVRTLPPHLRWTILALHISLKVWHPPRLLHSDVQ